MQLASILGDAKVKLVPDVVLGQTGGTLADALIAKMLVERKAGPPSEHQIATKNGTILPG